MADFSNKKEFCAQLEESILVNLQEQEASLFEVLEKYNSFPDKIGKNNLTLLTCDVARLLQPYTEYSILSGQQYHTDGVACVNRMCFSGIYEENERDSLSSKRFFKKCNEFHASTANCWYRCYGGDTTECYYVSNNSNMLGTGGGCDEIWLIHNIPIRKIKKISKNTVEQR